MASPPKSAVILGVFWSSLRSWGVRATTLGVFLVLARLLSPAEIGVVMFILGWLALIGIVGDLGLAEYVVYNDTAAKVDASIWWLQMGITLLMSFTLAIVVFFGIWEIDPTQPDAQMAMLALIITLPLMAAIKIPEAILRRRMEFKKLAIRSLISILFGAVVAVSLAYKGFGIWSLVFKQIIEAFFDLVLFFYYSRWLPSRPNLHAVKLAFLGGWGIVGSRILDVITQKADAVIIGSFIGMQELGFYSIALRVYQVVNEGVVQPVTSVVATAFGRVKTDPEKFKAFFLSAVQFAALITIPVFALAFALGGEWIPVVFGEQWQASSTIFQIMCISGILVGYSGLSGFSLLAQGRNKAFMLLMTYAAAAALLSLFLLAPFGVSAVAWMFPLKVLAVFPLSLLLARRLIGFRLQDYFLGLLPSLLLGLIVLAAAFGVNALMGVLDSSLLDNRFVYMSVNTGLVMLIIMVIALLGYKQYFKRIRATLHIQ